MRASARVVLRAAAGGSFLDAARGACAAALSLIALAAPMAHAQAPGPPRVLDDFQPLAGWSAQPSDGTTLRISSDGGAMRLDFDYHGGGGYAIAHKAFRIALPENYAFSFRVRGDAPVENLEFKLIDPTTENVWWCNQRNFHFPNQWRTVTIRKRHIQFAWGPKNGGTMDTVAAIEFSVTAGRGGHGTVWIDDLTFTPLEPVRPYDLTPVARATSSASGHAPAFALDADSTTAWRSGRGGAQSFTIDFGRTREYGGLAIDWAPQAPATHYVVETSVDGARWDSASAIEHGDGGRDWIYMPDTESRWLRLRLLAGTTASGYGIRGIHVEPLSFSDSRNAFFTVIAQASPRGSYPRYLDSLQSYWTVVGVNADPHEALMNADGMIEIGRGGFSLEPFVRLGDTVVTWADVRATQSLAEGRLPIPSVQWTRGPLALTVTATAYGREGASSLIARYRVRNTDSRVMRGTLYIALRPFQVNPPWQFLATEGGVAPIHRMTWNDRAVTVNGDRDVIALTPPAGFGAATFDEGGALRFIRSGSLPPGHSVTGDFGALSGALAYPIDLAPGAERDVYVEAPFEPDSIRVPMRLSADSARAYAERRISASQRTWHEQLDRVTIQLPPDATRVSETLSATLADILINDDGPAIQPGSRSYSRAWIRDGALISSALLRLGHPAEVRRFVEWFAAHQYPSGKVPCCVDERGADPVPENDSHGELIYAIAEYYRYTHDRSFLREMWPHVVKAVQYIDSLRHERLTPEYQSGPNRVYYGLLPQSISHEGYSAKPMHSYWDDLFALKGLKDAVAIAGALGHETERARWAAIRDEFRGDVYASIRLSMQQHGIDYIPGAAELGDFDATSTTIGVTPVDELGRLPEPALHQTFERYWRDFLARRGGSKSWDAYTPYELRTVGTFVHLGWKARAQEALDFFFQGQRPPAWREWAEVVWHDPTAPKFIGDMPHTWVGSDYIRSVLDMFAFERDADSALVVGAGVPEAWVASAPGVVVRGLRTTHGPLDLAMRAEGDSVVVRLGGLTSVPPGGIIVRNPLDRSLRSATVNGRPATIDEDAVMVRRVPAVIVLRPR